MCQQPLKIHNQDLKELSHWYLIFNKYWHLREIRENLKLADKLHLFKKDHCNDMHIFRLLRI